MIRIFVVDDDAANLQVAEHILNKNGMQVTALRSGQALLDHIAPQELPDLILLDIMMPQMDGFETLKRLRRMEQECGFHEIPVIFLTADDTAATEKLGFEAGVSDYIRKPFNPEILLRRVHNIVSKEQRLSSLRTEADTDKLTGFLNKAASARAIAGCCASDIGALLMIDLDSFKLVNDLYGHKTGDNVLICFAAILRGAAPKNSRFGRIGGDEFIVFAGGVQREEVITALTAKINADLVTKAKELMGDDMDIPLGASVGAVFVPRQGDDYETLFRMADQALYTVKKNGKHGCAFSHGDSGQAPESAGNSIERISEILGERSIPNVALQLEREAFSYVYRYIMRYMIRNQRCIYKVLFTLTPAEGSTEQVYTEECASFGDHIRESLRKTDILMRSRFNQYFVLLTDIRESDISIVIGNIMRRWEQNGSGGLCVSYETEFVSMPSRPLRKASEMRIAVAESDDAVLREIGTALSGAGFRVAAVKTGRALQKYLADNTVDLTVLDLTLPDTDGLALCRQLCSGTAPVLVLTDDARGSAAAGALELGAEELLEKPVDRRLLVHRVRRLTELAELRRSCRGGRKD